jgi:hypothetical protein
VVNGQGHRGDRFTRDWICPSSRIWLVLSGAVVATRTWCRRSAAGYLGHRGALGEDSSALPYCTVTKYQASQSGCERRQRRQDVRLHSSSDTDESLRRSVESKARSGLQVSSTISRTAVQAKNERPPARGTSGAYRKLRILDVYDRSDIDASNSRSGCPSRIRRGGSGLASAPRPNATMSAPWPSDCSARPRTCKLPLTINGTAAAIRFATNATGALPFANAGRQA